MGTTPASTKLQLSDLFPASEDKKLNDGDDD
jgi:hypothetical protein